MPGLNQKGPNGEGAMTGRRMGRCTSKSNLQETEAKPSENEKEQANETITGKGLGLGRGRGNGCRGGRKGRNTGLGQANRHGRSQ